MCAVLCVLMPTPSSCHECSIEVMYSMIVKINAEPCGTDLATDRSDRNFDLAQV